MKAGEVVGLTIALAVASWFVYINYFKPPAAPTKRAIERKEAREARKTQWAETSGEIQISESETVKRLKLYEPPFYDFPTICYVYTNQFHRTSNMVCPGTGPAFLDDD